MIPRRAPIVLLAASLVCVPVVAVGSSCNIVNGNAYGDCGNVTVNERTPYARVRGYERISEISDGATVYAGGRLDLSGTAEIVRVERGGKADISGVVTRVINNGGIVSITGVVTHLNAIAGTVEIEGVVSTVTGNGNIIRHSGSVIQGVPTP